MIDTNRMEVSNFMLYLRRISLFLFVFYAGCSQNKNVQPVLQEKNPLIRVLICDFSPELVFIPGVDWSVQTIEGTGVSTISKDTDVNISFGEGTIVARSGSTSYKGSALRFTSLLPDGSFRLLTNREQERDEGAIYEGVLEVFPGQGANLEAILEIPMEEYLKGVVPYEIGGDSPLEAMCAQAVAARSEAFAALVTRKYAGNHYDICSDVNCQVFRGNERCSPGSDEAVRLTRGHVLLFEGQPISAYYASNCGGHSEDIRNVWSDRLLEKAYWDSAGFDGPESASLDLTKEEDFRAWLDQSPDVYCNPQKYNIPAWAHKNFRWTREVSAEDLAAWVAEKKDVGRVTKVLPMKRGVSGRIIEVEFVGEKGSLVIGPELAIRRIFKPGLRSAAFAVDSQGPEGRPDRFIIRGAGSGHGVGMCQTGAIAMANSGKTFREILQHYYPKAKVEALY